MAIEALAQVANHIMPKPLAALGSTRKALIKVWMMYMMAINERKP